ncbi:J domain-containing protein [Parashewanella spongiae]|uniref:J domain-containing protein n=1 Tax=Parashewanella spongiae TaxID=342950 RepID=A0A3A6TG59_9GAMM|nr:J domain-containing protein [Parashewanella spongiae]MCL1079271.1 J domain-containing protein [Parashewanella spongiae]RJY06481.1 J domain-containing protein [Parashewanella spongiae]
MTRVRVSDIQSSDVTVNKNWKKLSTLWDQISKLQTRNQRLESKISTFYEQAKLQFESYEIQTCSLTAIKVERLISFIARRTIKGERRDALYELIHEELTALESNPFWTESTAELRNSFQNQIAADAQNQAEKSPEPDEFETEAFRDMLEDMLGVDIDFEHEKLVEMMKNPQDFEQYFHDIALSHKEKHADIENIDSMDEDELDEDFFERAFNNFKQEESAPSIDDIKMLFKSSDLNKLYKKVASRLHPDKESDESLKREKHELMQQLSKAKRDGDVFTLLQMGQKWLPDFELDLSPSALKSMIRVLETKVKSLNHQHRDISSDSSLKGIVWNRFSARSKKQQQTNIQEHIDSLIVCQADIQECIDTLTTVKSVNAYLKERIEEERWNYFPNVGDMHGCPF